MTRVGLYARVSTVNHGQDPEVQLRDMREYLNNRDGWRVIDDGMYVDRVTSAKMKRPGLDRLLTDVRAGKLDVVMVWKFDRMARSAIHLVQMLEEFQRHNVTFVSTTQQIDTATPAGKLVFTILGAVAEMERELIRERVNAGLRLARAKGSKLGRPRSTVDPIKVDAAVHRLGSIDAARRFLGIPYGLAYKVYHRPDKYAFKGAK